jgi:hypothetical protein
VTSFESIAHTHAITVYSEVLALVALLSLLYVLMIRCMLPMLGIRERYCVVQVRSNTLISYSGHERLNVNVDSDGKAYDLSVDHKPNNITEITRIRAAGGFVNSMGRVNGNLNLSRSLGDLKYKQLKHLPVEAQVRWHNLI